MQETRAQAGENGLSYEFMGEKVFITGYSGQASEVEIPARIEGHPVAGIARKAFLSKKALRGIVLPDTLEEVGDWAFAYCGGLVRISFPRQAVRFGKAVFLECPGLRRIEVREAGALDACACGDGAAGALDASACGSGAAGVWDASACGRDASDVPELLAAAVAALDAYYLLDLAEAGSGEWLEKWDARLAAVLHMQDDTGYSRQVLCGEEDYGSTDLEAYTSGARRRKVRLALLRLRHPRGLSAPLREELEEYLRGLTKGESREEAWEVVRTEHGNDREYYKLFAELGCVREDNLDGILADIGGEYPEMKAYFLKFREERLGGYDFFEELEL